MMRTFAVVDDRVDHSTRFNSAPQGPEKGSWLASVLKQYVQKRSVSAARRGIGQINQIPGSGEPIPPRTLAAPFWPALPNGRIPLWILQDSFQGATCDTGERTKAVLTSEAPKGRRV